MWLTFIAIVAQPAMSDLSTAQSPEGRLYRATNAWASCSSHVAEGRMRERPGQDTPQAIAEASADVCSDERAIVRALARDFAVSQNRQDVEGFADAVVFEMRSGIVTNLRNAIAAGAREAAR